MAQNTDDKIVKLLSCLNNERFGYNNWLDVGIVIYNETKNINLWKIGAHNIVNILKKK